jgi:hypothetical protein
MAEVIRKTEAKFPGPWLLDRAALAALDEIIEEQWSRLESYKEWEIELADVDNEIRQRAHQDSRYSGDGRAITLTLKSGNKIRVNSFVEAMNDANCQEHEIAKVEVKLYCGGVRGDFVIPTAGVGQGLSLVTLPEASEQAAELFVRLNRWAEQYKPDWLRQIRGLGFPFALIIALFGILILLMIGSITGSVTETNTLTDAIRDLVAKGVKPEDYGRALELLLRQSAAFPKQPGITNLPVWFDVAAAAIAIIAGLLSLPARTAFEIGKGAANVLRQKRYDWFLRTAIPTFFILGVAASALGSFVFELLRPK